MGQGRAAAVYEVRRQQERAWLDLVPGGREANDAGAIIEQALLRADKREQEADADKDHVYASGFRYPIEMERLRWARTRDIIHRVAPGPYEDSTYLEMLARQAASVEIILSQAHTGQPSAKIESLCKRLILGTLPSLSPTASTSKVRNYSTLFVSGGLIDFLYQLAKYVLLSWDINRGDDRIIRTDGRPDTMDRVLAEKPEIIDQLIKTYLAFIYEGRPRCKGGIAAPPEIHTPLQVLVNFNERFILAHEYAHTLFDAIGGEQSLTMTERDEESHADVMAFFLVNESGLVLDGMPPVVSSQGIFFVLAAMETLRRAVDLARHGEVRKDEGFASHPPVAQRHALMKNVYLQKISDKDDDQSIDGALTPTRSLLHLWQHLESPLIEQHRRGRPLHAMWADTTGL